MLGVGQRRPHRLVDLRHDGVGQRLLAVERQHRADLGVAGTLLGHGRDVGQLGEPLGPTSAIAFSRPALTCCMTSVVLTIARSSRLASRSCTPGGRPL